MDFGECETLDFGVGDAGDEAGDDGIDIEE